MRKKRQRRDEENKRLGMGNCFGVELGEAGQRRGEWKWLNVCALQQPVECVEHVAHGGRGEVKNQVALKSQSLHSLLF